MDSTLALLAKMLTNCRAQSYTAPYSEAEDVTEPRSVSLVSFIDTVKARGSRLLAQPYKELEKEDVPETVRLEGAAV